MALPRSGDGDQQSGGVWWLSSLTPRERLPLYASLKLTIRPPARWPFLGAVTRRWWRLHLRRSYELLSQIAVGSDAARLPPLLTAIIGTLAPHAPSPSHGAAATAVAALSAGRLVDAVATLGVLQLALVRWTAPIGAALPRATTSGGGR